MQLGELVPRALMGLKAQTRVPVPPNCMLPGSGWYTAWSVDLREPAEQVQWAVLFSPCLSPLPGDACGIFKEPQGTERWYVIELV